MTESDYIAGVRRLKRLSTVDVNVVAAAGVPVTIVETAITRYEEARREAKRRKDPLICYDKVWCVFDVDTHPNLDQAKARASARGFSLAISNPCVEVWLLVHHQDFTRPCSGADVLATLKTHEPTYRKAIEFGKYWPNYPDAKRRALELDRKHELDGSLAGSAPSTGMVGLIEYLLSIKNR